MTKTDFLSLVTREGISNDSWSINENCDERYCLIDEADAWIVYYFERGYRRSEVRHSTKSEGLSDLFDRLVRDDTTRIAYRARHKWPG